MFRRAQIDFTEGSIIRKLILFSVPIVLAEVLQNLYNTADSLVVGNFVGSEALAAVSVCSVISNMVVGFFNGMSVGASVVAARFFGSGDRDRLSAGIRNTFAFSVLSGILLSIAGIAAVPALVRLVSVPASVEGDAVVYLRIYLAGVMFTVIYNVAAGLLRAVGDSASPSRILMAVCALNVALDLFFVVFLKWGVAGVGAATVISQLMSVLLVFRKLREYDKSFCLTFSELRKEWSLVRTMISIGCPAGLQNSLTLFSNLFVWRYISGFGAAALAGMGAGARIDKFVSMPCKAFGLACTTFVSQNFGAGKIDRVHRGFRCCLALTAAYCAVLIVLLWTGAERAVGLFSQDAGVVQIGVDMMHMMLPCFLFMAVRESCLGVLRGYGDSKTPMLLSLLCMVGLRQLYLAVALSLDHRILHIYIGYPLAWGATGLTLLVYYLMKRKSYEAVPRR